MEVQEIREGQPTTRREMLLAAGATCLVAAAPQTTPASNAEGVPDVGGKDRRWDADIGMLGEKSGGAGYSTRLPRGTWVHASRSNLDYAQRLLDTGSAPALARAELVIGKVIALQDIDPASPTYGIWSYYLEETLAQMDPPDWNWADFNGARLIAMIGRHGDRLNPALLTGMRKAVGRAGEAIMRRDVGPAYTNISVMGARVTLAAGELMQDPKLLAYGRKRLLGLLDYTCQQGSFNEYNSPTYTMVALEEIEAILSFIKDGEARGAAAELHRITWEMIASHWHPGTNQWAGPHSRAYYDRTPNPTLDGLSARLGHSLRPGMAVPPREVPMLPCPPALAPRFAALPKPDTQVRQRFIRAEDDGRSVYGTTWLNEAACLGSANAESFWTQRHPLIAFWRTARRGPTPVFRVRCEKDGRDFASFGMVATQQGQRVLMSAHPIANSGDWHITLDRAASFPGQELQLRFVLDGPGATARALDEYRVELVAGEWKAVIHMGPAIWNNGVGPQGRWAIEKREGAAHVAYVVPLGGSIAPTMLGRTSIPAAIEILPVAAKPSKDRIEVTPNAGGRLLRWNGIELAAPVSPPAPIARIS